MKELAADLPDRLYGDKGYISQAMTDDLAQEGLTLVTGQRKNMKAKELSFFDRAMLSKRFIIETINDQLKNISQIEHSRHRSLHGFMLNLLGGLTLTATKKINQHSTEYQCSRSELINGNLNRSQVN